MLNICSSVQDHNQSNIQMDSDWTSQRPKEFYLKPRASGRMHLKKCVWRSASEDTSLKIELLKTCHQKQGHQKQWSLAASHQKRLHQSWQVQRMKCTTTNSATTIFATLSLHQDKFNSNIAADFVPFQVEWIWN